MKGSSGVKANAILFTAVLAAIIGMAACTNDKEDGAERQPEAANPSQQQATAEAPNAANNGGSPAGAKALDQEEKALLKEVDLCIIKGISEANIQELIRKEKENITEYYNAKKNGKGNAVSKAALHREECLICEEDLLGDKNKEGEGEEKGKVLYLTECPNSKLQNIFHAKCFAKISISISTKNDTLLCPGCFIDCKDMVRNLLVNCESDKLREPLRTKILEHMNTLSVNIWNFVNCMDFTIDEYLAMFDSFASTNYNKIVTVLAESTKYRATVRKLMINYQGDESMAPLRTRILEAMNACDPEYFRAFLGFIKPTFDEYKAMHNDIAKTDYAQIQTILKKYVDHNNRMYEALVNYQSDEPMDSSQNKVLELLNACPVEYIDLFLNAVGFTSNDYMTILNNLIPTNYDQIIITIASREECRDSVRDVLVDHQGDESLVPLRTRILSCMKACPPEILKVFMDVMDFTPEEYETIRKYLPNTYRD